MVFISDVNPSRAKNSHCRGIIMELDATIALIVKRPKAGGQSIIIKS